MWIWISIIPTLAVDLKESVMRGTWSLLKTTRCSDSFPDRQAVMQAVKTEPFTVTCSLPALMVQEYELQNRGVSYLFEELSEVIWTVGMLMRFLIFLDVTPPWGMSRWRYQRHGSLCTDSNDCKEYGPSSTLTACRVYRNLQFLWVMGACQWPS